MDKKNHKTKNKQPIRQRKQSSLQNCHEITGGSEELQKSNHAGKNGVMDARSFGKVILFYILGYCRTNYISR